MTVLRSILYDGQYVFFQLQRPARKQVNDAIVI